MTSGRIIYVVWLALVASFSSMVALPREAQEPSGVAAAAAAFMRQLAGGDFDGAVKRFDAAMAKAMPAEKLREAWGTVAAQAGGFINQSGARTETIGGARVVFVTCQFRKGALDAKVVFDAGGRISGLWFLPAGPQADPAPPPYANPGLYVEREVTVGSGEWQLPGTLTMPKRSGHFPAIVLVHGSGPHDRDEAIGPNKPFCDLAWGLASRGVAVLRYEKRTKEYGPKMAGIDSLTVKEETVDDATAATALVRATPGIVADRVFVLGHSLGGMLIPRIGEADSRIAGFIVMAGTARPLEQVALGQVRYMRSLGMPLSDPEREGLEQIEKDMARVTALCGGETLPSGTRIGGAPVAYWLDLRGYNPPEAAKRLGRPMLILQGERDYQVTAEDFQAWKAALSGTKNVEFKLYPRLNHLFMPGEGPSLPSDYAKPGHVDEAVVADIAAWVRHR